MIKILFICHGNICRSPMAEFFMKDLVEKRGLSRHFFIASAATSREEIGNPPHPGTRRILAAHGIPCAGKRAVQLRREDYATYDLLIAMEEYNLSNMRRLLDGDPEHKCCLLLDFTDHPRAIADPWYTGNFEETFADISCGCEALLTHLLATRQELAAQS